MERGDSRLTRARRSRRIRVRPPLRPKAKGTQTSIARDLGLSQATVTQALNGVVDRSDRTIDEQVWAHEVKVGYRSNGMTPHAPLSAAGARQIGVVLRAGLQPFVQSNFFSHVQVGLHGTLQPHGF